MRWTWLPLFVLVGCGAEPYCGFDEAGEERPSCVDETEAVPLERCPGEHWANAECKSCACDSDGEILCTSVIAEGCEQPEG